MRKYTFLKFCDDNETLVLALALLVAGLIALACDYKEGFLSITSGVVGMLKSNKAPKASDKLGGGNDVAMDQVGAGTDGAEAGQHS